METKVIKKISKKGEASYEYYVDGVKVRKSNRLYIASTANGEMFWGKAHLIGNGMYKHFMESIARWEAATYEKVQKEYEKRIAKARKDREEYHSLAHYLWYRNLINWRQEKGLATCEELNAEAEKRWEEEKALADKWLGEAIADNTKPMIEKEVERRHKWAENRKKDLQIVRYDISNL